MNPDDAMVIVLKDIYVCQVLSSYTQFILVDIIYKTF